MKILATWFRHGRGLALGVLVGALTLGKAAPYLINGIGSQNWRHNVMFVSLLAVVGGLLVLLFVTDGPYALPAARFDWKQVGKYFAIAACGWPTSATSVTCGSCMRCGRGSLL